MTEIIFKKATLDDIAETTDGQRGRVSYPIIKGFMETGYQIAEVDMVGMKRKPQTLLMLLKSFVGTHRMPIKVMLRKNRLFLIRLDIDDKGNPIPDWFDKLQKEKVEEIGEVEEITTSVIDRE